MTTSDIVAAITPIADALLTLHVPYGVVGSVASSAHGIARTTLDVDDIDARQPAERDHGEEETHGEDAGDRGGGAGWMFRDPAAAAVSG